ncbi:PalH-domain-containing protein [Venturia nashicola]|uniref:PalH-domain-containing protein n=1 Tax=Venturia nashicola TaxID=86259 RepID=A0A4Z1NTI8_9PEZI|nr:PalH-domain-containing protein [Venturia nashicola]TLD29751.1 PalH-domain-containing protein [Venturia nashicola]
MIEDKVLGRRQMFPPSTTTEHTTRTQRPHCTPFTLPSNGHLVINPTSTITLSGNAVFTPECSPQTSLAAAFPDGGISGITDLKDPFHASVTPQAYATGAATVIAWMLCIMLMITPRTFFIGGAGGGFGMLNRHGMISGAQGTNSIIGVGSRPWLQKVAALTVAISLTIATADTFKVAERQYLMGYMNAEALRTEVVGSTEIKVSRIISDIFLWLAQVQTLIRLFPRHKEKVLIKWIGFALIILDSTFSCLNSFMGNHTPKARPRRFQDAIPALSYLFQLALSMLYAAWVIYYAICKRRYAFYHKDMKNIIVVAFMSMIAISTPVVFFITDISNASVAGWGDYFRWVGAAAASVIVWEWVERIEALEREEKKDGILGREVFDGDEMLETSRSEEVVWPQRRRFWSRRGGNDSGNSMSGATAYSSGQDLTNSQKFRDSGRMMFAKDNGQKRLSKIGESSKQNMSGLASEPYPTPPPPAISPVSRTDTASAASTVYTVRYHTIATPTPPVVRYAPHRVSQQGPSPVDPRLRFGGAEGDKIYEKDFIEESEDIEHSAPTREPTSRFQLSNPFKRRKAAPPAEIANARVIDPVPIASTRPQPAHNYQPWDVKGRLGAFAAEQGDKWREKRSGDKPEVDLPVTIIPANPRGRTWSPAAPMSQENTLVNSERSPRLPSTRHSSDDGGHPADEMGDEIQNASRPGS